MTDETPKTLFGLSSPGLVLGPVIFAALVGLIVLFRDIVVGAPQ